MASENNLPSSTVKSQVPSSIPLGNGASIDLGFLSEEERKEMVKAHAGNLLKTAGRAHDLNVDVQNVRQHLGTLTDEMTKSAEAGLSVTTTYTQNVQGGRIEVIAGNTDAASKGRLSRSQSGEKDWTPVYIIGGLVAVVLIAFLFAGGR